MTVTVTRAGIPIVVRNESITIQDALDQRSTATYTERDDAGSQHYQGREPVVITDNLLGQRFTGYVSDATETNFPPSSYLEHAVNCFDQNDLAVKRVSKQDYTNQVAGDIAVDLLATTLAAEGVTAPYAQATTSSADEWATGQLTGVVPASALGDGDLELASAGIAVSKTENTTAAWNSNVSLVGLDSTGGVLQLASHATMRYSGTCGSNFPSNTFAYTKFADSSYVIQAGDVFTYKVWINSTSPAIVCGLDFICSDGTTMRDSGLVDQNALPAHPAQDLSTFANDQWYSRQIGIGALAGKTISYFQIAFENGTAGNYLAYIRDVVVYASNLTTVRTSPYSSSGSHSGVLPLPRNARISDSAYSNILLVPVVAYEVSGTRISTTTPLAPAAICQQSLISWLATVPANTTLDLSTSVDGGATWQSAATFSAIAGLLPGMALFGRTMQTKQTLTLTGKDPTVTPTVTSIAWTVLPAYRATKLDTFKAFGTQAQFNAGTNTNTTNLAAGGVQIKSYQRDWNDETLANQTLFGSASPTQSIYERRLKLTSNNVGDVRARLDGAGTWGGTSQDFTASVDVQIGTQPNEWAGIEYMTTSWANTANSYAYKVDLSQSTLNLDRGTNGGAGGTTNLATKTFAVAFTAGNTHTITVAYTGATHTHSVALDGVVYLTFVDATYTAAGNVGVIFRNDGGSAQQVFFDNFGIIASAGLIPATPIPVWLSPVISVGSLTVGTSAVAWNALAPNGTTVVVNAKVNAGAFAACTNGQAIPGLAAGTVLTGATVQFQVQLQSSAATATPVLQGLSASVLSAYSSSGSRISPALALDAVGRVGSTLVTWNGVVPSGCSLFIDTALNTPINWTQVGSGAQGNAPVAGITGQADPIEDTFDSLSSSFYTNTSQTGGTPATWTWDTANSRVVASGGALAQLLYSSLTDDDVDMTADLDTSDAGGLCWRVSSSSTCYDLAVCDGSSPTPGAVTLTRLASGVATTLATATVTWPRVVGAPRRIHVVMSGPLITVSFDGSQIISYTDNHPLPAGQCGLRTDTNAGASAAQCTYLRIQAQGDSVLGVTVFTRARLVSTDARATSQLGDLTVSARSPAIFSGAFIPNTAFSVLNGSTNTVSADLDDIARQSNGWWRIDDTRAFTLQAHNGTLAPWCLSAADLLLPFGVTVKRAMDMYRNTPYVLGGTDTVLATQPFVTDGINQTFTASYPVDSIVSVTAGNGAVTYTFGVKGVDTGKDFYYQQGNNTINQDEGELPLPPGITLLLTYYKQINVVASVSNASDIAQLAARDGTSGIVEIPETAPGTNAAAAIQLATARQVQYKPPSAVLTATTTRAGLRVGQLLCVFLPQHGITDGQFLITAMTTMWRTDRNRDGVTIDATPYFTITAESGPLRTAWAKSLAQMGR